MCYKHINLLCKWKGKAMSKVYLSSMMNGGMRMWMCMYFGVRS